MELTLRAGTTADAQACGDICFSAFSSVSRAHNFPPDFDAPETARGLMTMILSNPEVHSVIAESRGKIVGSNFLWEWQPIAGIGPITVAPEAQNSSVGRRLMENALNRATAKQQAGVRLVQAAFHNRSLSLYTKLGFQVREPLATLHGPPIARKTKGFPVRPAKHGDLVNCDQLCRSVHGHSRSAELQDAIRRKTATVVERDGRISGYATLIAFFGHAVAETDDDLIALIAAAPSISLPGFLVPTRNTRVFRWCLQNGFRVTQPMTLMSLGLYNEPTGAFLPSILY